MPSFRNGHGKKRKFSDSDVSEEEDGLADRDEDEELSNEDVADEDEVEDDEDSESDMEQDDDGRQDDDSEHEEDEADTEENDSDDNSFSAGKVSSQDSTLQPAASELDRAKAVTCQLRFWEHLLKMRVNLQKAMVIINQLPQCDKLHELVSSSGEPCHEAMTAGRTALKQLLGRLLELEFLLLNAKPETKSLLSSVSQQTGKEKETAVEADDEEITSESEAGSDEENLDVSTSHYNQSVKSSEFPQLIAKRHKAVEQYRNNTIQKWADKTQSLSKFSAFDQSVAKQIQQTLADKSRLIARTKVNRLGNRVLGKSSPAAASDMPASTSSDQDEEIFDDNDFYHHILREFIQYKNSYDPIVLTKQWLEIQQYRKKAKKNVDRKASKGRKTRYNVHKPLINFMAPLNSPDAWTNEQRDDLFKNLFGKALTGAV